MSTHDDNNSSNFNEINFPLLWTLGYTKMKAIVDVVSAEGACKMPNGGQPQTARAYKCKLKCPKACFGLGHACSV